MDAMQNITEMSQSLDRLQELARRWGAGYDWQRVRSGSSARRRRPDFPDRLVTQRARTLRPAEPRA